MCSPLSCVLLFMINDQLIKRKVVWEKRLIELKMRDLKFCRTEILHCVVKIETISLKPVHSGHET